MERSLFEKEEKGEILQKLKIDLISRFYPLSENEILQFKGVLNFDNSHLMSNESIYWSENLIDEVKEKIDWTILIGLKNIYLDLHFIKKFEKYIDFKGIWYSKNVKWSKELIDIYEDKIQWGGFLILQEPFSTIENLRKYKEILDWSIVSRGIKIPFSDDVFEEFKDYWDWKKLSSNPNLPLSVEFIQKYIDKLDFDQLSINPTSLPIIYKYPTSKRWNWNKVVINRGLEYSKESFDFLLLNYEKYVFPEGIKTELIDILVTNSLIQRIFKGSQKDLNFFFSKWYIKFVPWDILSKRSNTLLDMTFINTHKEKLNFKESDLIKRIKDIVTTDFIIENKELFDSNRHFFYDLPLTIDLLENHFTDIYYFYLSKCHKLDWNWDFIYEHLYEFDSVNLSLNDGIYKRLIEKMNKEEILSILEESRKVNNLNEKTKNLKTISPDTIIPFSNDDKIDDEVRTIEDLFLQIQNPKDVWDYIDDYKDDTWMYDTNI